MRRGALPLALMVLGPLLLSALALLQWGAALPFSASAATDPARPWALIAVLALPGLLWAPGLGWARWLARARPVSRLQLGLDSAWLSLGFTWIDVALVREVGLREGAAAWGQLGLALGWGLAGLVLARGAPPPTPTPRMERRAAALVALAVILVGVWKAGDLARPLDGHWYLAGADAEGREPLHLLPGEGWRDEALVGWPEAGARRLTPSARSPTLLAPDGARGRVALAIRGPVGSTLSVGAQKVAVEASVTEVPEEGPVRRYLRAGVAGMMVDLDLDPGEALKLEVDSPAATIYLLPGTDAVWSLHASGELRYVHYYQLLNLVENQVWAEELLADRWITLNQPPGWSPILALATLWVLPDLQGANTLFLGVILLVGLSAVRLMGVLVPAARGAALALPAAMTMSHGLLMIEPGSTNFPDSLYAGALIAVAAALAGDRPGWFGGLGVAAAILRYPGGPVVLILLGAWTLLTGVRPWQALRRLGVSAAVAAAGGLALLLGGHMEDVGFILYFETFPEHWHGDYQPSSLLPRVPEFYATLLRYCGGAALLAFAGLFAPPSPERRATAFLLGSFGAYSLILCTVDHHPSHYFLPLVAVSGPALAAAATSIRRPILGIALPILALIGVAIFLRSGQV